ncbi:MAG: YybH family protein [Saprospiraceae bacterium]
MKKALKLFFLPTLLCAFFTVSAQSQSADEAVIKKLLYDCTMAALTGDYDAWAATYAHVPYLYVNGVTAQSPTKVTGWEAFSELRKPAILNNAKNKGQQLSLTHENMNIRVSGNTAWAYYDQTNPNGAQSWEHRVLEKINGTWKIVSMTAVYHSSWKKEAAKN